jgi:iron complex transport system substrate-binding protein
MIVMIIYAPAIQPYSERGKAVTAAQGETGSTRGTRLFVFFVLLVFLLPISCARSTPPKPGTPQRIVSVVPNVTEMLFALGLGDKVIGVSDFDHFPAEVEKKERVGGLINPNIEKIISMHPDLVITYGTQDVLKQNLQSVGIAMFPFVHGNVDHTLQFMADLGHATGTDGEARRIVAEIRKNFDEVRAHAPADHPKVLVVTGRTPGTLGSFYSVGRRAFQHDLIEIAGGRNLFADVDQEAIQPTLEEVISRKPDIIIETLSPPLDPAEVAQRKKDWETLKLAKDRIYIEGESYLLVPGPRFGLAARRLSEIIAP